MGENTKINEKCIKGNVVYYKIKINEIVNNEINNLGANEEKYQKLNCKISSNFKKFSDKLIAGGDFTSAMVSLRDDVISECVEVDKNPDKNLGEVEKSTSSEMRPFFKNYVFDKIYSMGINIKNGAFPEDYNQELEQEKLRIEEENKLKDEEERLKSEEEKEQEEREINIKVENESEQKQPDLVDQIFSYFFGSSKSSTSDKNKKPEKETEKEKKVKV